MKINSLKFLNSDEDFSKFVDAKFDKPVEHFIFPEKFDSRRTPQSFLKKVEPVEAQNIQKRERIRDNIYIDYKFDIFEYPFIVYYENGYQSTNIEPFKKLDEAKKFASKLRSQGIYSLLIMIMNHEIKCEVYKA